MKLTIQIQFRCIIGVVLKSIIRCQIIVMDFKGLRNGFHVLNIQATVKFSLIIELGYRLFGLFYCYATFHEIGRGN